VTPLKLCIQNSIKLILDNRLYLLKEVILSHTNCMLSLSEPLQRLRVGYYYTEQEIRVSNFLDTWGRFITDLLANVLADRSASSGFYRSPLQTINSISPSLLSLSLSHSFLSIDSSLFCLG